MTECDVRSYPHPPPFSEGGALSPRRRCSTARLLFTSCLGIVFVALTLKLLPLLLRPQVGPPFHVTSAAYSCERGGRITQLQYLFQLSLRTSMRRHILSRPTWRPRRGRAQRLCVLRYASIRTCGEPTLR